MSDGNAVPRSPAGRVDGRRMRAGGFMSRIWTRAGLRLATP